MEDVSGPSAVVVEAEEACDLTARGFEVAGWTGPTSAVRFLLAQFLGLFFFCGFETTVGVGNSSSRDAEGY